MNFYNVSKYLSSMSDVIINLSIDDLSAASEMAGNTAAELLTREVALRYYPALSAVLSGACAGNLLYNFASSNTGLSKKLINVTALACSSYYAYQNPLENTESILTLFIAGAIVTNSLGMIYLVGERDAVLLKCEEETLEKEKLSEDIKKSNKDVLGIKKELDELQTEARRLKAQVDDRSKEVEITDLLIARLLTENDNLIKKNKIEL